MITEPWRTIIDLSKWGFFALACWLLYRLYIEMKARNGEPTDTGWIASTWKGIKLTCMLIGLYGVRRWIWKKK